LPELLRLTAAQRARLAFELVQSLDESSDLDSEQAWLTEIEKRVKEVLAGEVKLESWSVARHKIEARLRRARR